MILLYAWHRYTGSYGNPRPMSLCFVVTFLIFNLGSTTECSPLNSKQENWEMHVYVTLFSLSDLYVIQPLYCDHHYTAVPAYL